VDKMIKKPEAEIRTDLEAVRTELSHEELLAVRGGTWGGPGRQFFHEVEQIPPTPWKGGL
jgi:hypothetical protein